MLAHAKYAACFSPDASEAVWYLLLLLVIETPGLAQQGHSQGRRVGNVANLEDHSEA